MRVAKKTLTPEHAALLREASRLRSARRQDNLQNAIVVGKHQVWKSDEDNWGMGLVGGDPSNPIGWYPTMVGALCGVLHKELELHAKRDLESVRDEIAAAERRIVAAVRGLRP